MSSASRATPVFRPFAYCSREIIAHSQSKCIEVKSTLIDGTRVVFKGANDVNKYMYYVFILGSQTNSQCARFKPGAYSKGILKFDFDQIF